MPKRIIICLLILCILLTLTCCGRAEVLLSGSVASDCLDTMNSISETFLNVHYSVSMEQVQLYDLIEGIPTTIPNAKNEVEKQTEELIKQKYQTQPLTDKGLKSIKTNGSPETLWKVALSSGTIDIKITSVRTSPKNVDIYDKQNDINYTVNLLINGTSYEVNGTLVLVNIDNKWLIDDINESVWSPALSYSYSTGAKGTAPSVLATTQAPVDTAPQTDMAGQRKRGKYFGCTVLCFKGVLECALPRYSKPGERI